MIPYDLDPSLHTTEPHEPALDDGFSRPHSHDAAQEDVSQAADSPATAGAVDPSLQRKSAF